MVNNDGSRDSFVILTGLKCIFQKQLPKMPKDYIARLVYDRSHLSIAIVKHPLEVVGYVYTDRPREGGATLLTEHIGGLHTDPSTVANSQKSCSAPSPLTNKSRATVPI